MDATGLSSKVKVFTKTCESRFLKGMARQGAVAGSIGLMKSRRATVSNTALGRGTSWAFSSWHFAVAAIAGKHHLVKVIDAAAEPVSHEVSLQLLARVDRAMGFEVDGLGRQLIGGKPLSIALASVGLSASTFR
jgi:hypothetical protein